MPESTPATDPFNPKSKRDRIASGYDAYKNDLVEVLEPDLTGFTHLFTSRHGLFAASVSGYQRIAAGFYFGLTLRQDGIYAFESCDQPRGPTRMGRLIRFQLKDHQISSTQVLAKGFDNGCHGMDFVHGRLHLVDCYNQQIVRFLPGETEWELLSPLPTCQGRWLPNDPDYRHMNGILGVGDQILVMLHNGAQHTGLPSQIAFYDRDWTLLRTITLDGQGCHSLALLPSGEILACGSMEGNLLGTSGLRLRISPYMTRGLAIGTDSIVAGASRLALREDRNTADGTLIFMNRDYNVNAELYVPAAPMELRRLDGEDASLSEYLERQPWATGLGVPA